MGWLCKALLAISPEQATVARRGFRDTGARQRLERIGATFLAGYHTALENGAPMTLARRLNAVEAELRGFAFEGASMALALLDLLTPWNRNRLAAYLEGPATPHAYMAHVGAGWALARLRLPVERTLARLDPLLGWLAVDGYGFHEGYFRWRRAVREQSVPGQLAGYARRVFDQGLGRSLWFVEGADVGRIPVTIAAFAPSRRGDLWSGVGLASAYAGGVDEAALEALREPAGEHRSALAQGAAFAAKARQRAGNPASHTEVACRSLCGTTADEAAAITDAALNGLGPDGTDPAYEVWRRRIQARLEQEAAVG